MIGGIIAATAGHRRAVGSLDPDAQLYINAMTTAPSAARQTIINQFFLDLKAAGAFALLDELWLLAAHDSQASLLGIKRYKDSTAVNAPTFVADQGWTGAAARYITTGFVASVDGVNYALNNASLGMYCRTDAALGSVACGAWSPQTAQVIPRWSDGLAYVRVNQSDLDFLGLAVPNSLGLLVGRRTTATAYQMYKNGTEIATDTDPSTALPAHALYLLGQNDSGALAASDAIRQYALAFVGAALTPAGQLSLFNAVETYLDAIGAGVVP